MADPYTPLLSDFAFTEAEEQVVIAALATESPWDWTPDSKEEKAALKGAKARILDFHLQRHGYCCCYCRTNLHGAGPFMTDREHVLPKSNELFRLLTYTLWNLAASCKRCNLQFKRSGEKFVVHPDDATKYQDSDNYLFIHPNFDLWSEHLSRMAIQENTALLVKYSVAQESRKGAYTYDFFALGELEIDSFDEVQGRPPPRHTELAVRVRALADQFDQ